MISVWRNLPIMIIQRCSKCKYLKPNANQEVSCSQHLIRRIHIEPPINSETSGFGIVPRIIEKLDFIAHEFLTNYQSGCYTIYMSLTYLSQEIRNLALCKKWLTATGS